MKNGWNPAKWLLVLIIRGYQTLISPALPRSCKYHPSCSQYAIDALSQYGVARGLILAGWRLLRCNPLSYGGYDPVENQTLFRKRIGSLGSRGSRPRESGALPRARRVGVPTGIVAKRHILMILLAAILLLTPVIAASCSLPGQVPTTASTTTVSGSSTTGVGGTTSTTLAQQRQPGQFDKWTKPLQALFFWILDAIEKGLSIPWSWAIVLLTVIVRLILVPLTWRQIKSMRAMQALQPQLKVLQEKYKNDRQLLNQKTMEFYRENKVNPMGSCLPLLLQLPVFIGLFYMLRTAGTPNLDPAIWGRWASQFAAPNPPVSWLWISDITHFSYILMILYIASQFFASWQMARKQAGQQKAIALFMPIMVGVFMFIYKWPAGLMIYWFTSNLWTIAQQYAAEKLMPMHVPEPVIPAKEKPSAPAPRPSSGPAGKTPPRAAGKPASAPAGGGRTPGKATGSPAGKSGGKSSGQKTGQQGKATGSKGQRPNRGTGRAKSSSGA